MSYIFLSGNPGDGFTAIGPFEDVDEAFEDCDGLEGWLMTLYPSADESNDIL